MRKFYPRDEELEFPFFLLFSLEKARSVEMEDQFNRVNGLN